MQLMSRVSSRPTLRDTIDTPENNYTFLRLILASSVIYYHSFGLTRAEGFTDYVTKLLSPVTTTGGLAVQAFFFLSGLFVSQSFFRDRNVVSFLVKRVLRIWPGFFICLVVTALISVAISRPKDFHHYLLFDGLYDYIVRNTIFQLRWTIDGVFTTHPDQTINGPIHTLPLEAKMYAVLAVVGLFGFISTTRRIAVAGCVLMALALIPGVAKALPFVLFDMEWSQTAGMMFLAGILAFGLAHRIRPALWQGAAALAVVLISQGTFHVVAFYALVIWCLFWLGQWRGLGRLHVRQDLSYGIYLYGWPAQQMVIEFFPRMDPYTLFIVALSIASVFAWLSWILVEKHAIALGKFLGAVNFVVWRAPVPRRAASSVAFVGFVFVSCVALFVICRTRDFAPVVAMPVAILDFGPKESPAGRPINEQPDGSSALWLSVSEAPPDGVVVVFGNSRLSAQVGNGVITAVVPNAQLMKPGPRDIHLERRTAVFTERSNSIRIMLQ